MVRAWRRRGHERARWGSLVAVVEPLEVRMQRVFQRRLVELLVVVGGIAALVRVLGPPHPRHPRLPL